MARKSISRSIGANIRQFRTEKGLSQEELAAALYVTRQTISNYEVGRSQPDVDMLQRIAAALDVELVWLLYGKPESPSRRQKRRTAILLAVSLAWLVLSGILYWFAASAARRTYVTMPRILIRLILVPSGMALLGAALTQLLDCVFGFERRVNRKLEAVGRWTVIGFSAVHALLVLPFLIWCGWILIQILSGANSIAMTFPRIPVYQELLAFFLNLLYHNPFVYLFLGAAWRLFCVPPSSANGLA